jgi:hypothetical protein
VGELTRFAIAKVSDPEAKPYLLIHVAQVLRRARKLPVGQARSDLRQLARGLLKLHRDGLRANVEIVISPTKQ